MPEPGQGWYKGRNLDVTLGQTVGQVQKLGYVSRLGLLDVMLGQTVRTSSETGVCQ